MLAYKTRVICQNIHRIVKSILNRSMKPDEGFVFITFCTSVDSDIDIPRMIVTNSDEIVPSRCFVWIFLDSPCMCRCPEFPLHELIVNIFISAKGVIREYSLNVTLDKHFQIAGCCLTIIFVNVSYRMQRSVWNMERACVFPPMNASSTNTTCTSTTVGYLTVLATNSK